MENKTKKQIGFTLLEVMIVVAIVGIMVALAAPSLSRSYQNQQLESSKDLFLRHLIQARLEARSRGERVALCVADAAMEDCNNNPDQYWGTGWLMFIDRDGDATVDTAEAILQKGTTYASDVGIYQDTVTGGQFGYISYDSRGFGRGRGNTVISGTFCMADRRYTGGNQRYVRRVTLDTFGRIFDRTGAEEQTAFDSTVIAAERCGGAGGLCDNANNAGLSTCRREQI